MAVPPHQGSGEVLSLPGKPSVLGPFGIRGLTHLGPFGRINSKLPGTVYRINSLNPHGHGNI